METWVLEDLEQGSANYRPWAKSSLLLVVVNKVLWEHSPPICLLLSVAALHDNGRVELLGQGPMAHKAKHIDYLTLQGKCVLTFGLEEQSWHDLIYLQRSLQRCMEDGFGLEG